MTTRSVVQSEMQTEPQNEGYRFVDMFNNFLSLWNRRKRRNDEAMRDLKQLVERYRETVSMLSKLVSNYYKTGGQS